MDPPIQHTPTFQRFFPIFKKDKREKEKLTEKCPVDGCPVVGDDSVGQLAQSEIARLISIVGNVVEILCPVDDQMLAGRPSW